MLSQYRISPLYVNNISKYKFKLNKLNKLLIIIIFQSLQSVGYMPAVNSINFWKRINSCKQHSINGFRRPRLIGITELPPPYPNGWYCILESSSLIAKNVTYVSCLGEHFVVFRTFDGQVNVLDAYCPHLGANMGLNGQVKGDNIECPFHQWSFRGSDGTCANIPYSHTGKYLLQWN